jgi:proline dehydrogenase
MIRLCCFIDFAQPKEGRKEEKKRREQLYRLFYQMENKRKTTKVSAAAYI